MDAKDNDPARRSEDVTRSEDGYGGAELNISGLVVDTEPDETRQVSVALTNLDGVVAMEMIAPNRIAVVIEAGTVIQELGVSRLINEMPGVLGVYLAFHDFGKTQGDDGAWGDGKRRGGGDPGTWG